MTFHLKAVFTLSADVSAVAEEVTIFFKDMEATLVKDTSADRFTFDEIKPIGKTIQVTVSTKGTIRPHNKLLQIKNNVSKHLGKQHRVGVRGITVVQYDIEFDVEKPPLKPVTVPFATVDVDGKHVHITLDEVDDEFLKKNYIDRIITRVQEKIEDQYYEGKGEYWKSIWESPEKPPVTTNDPTEEMIKQGWLQQGPTKGKWFYRAQAAAVLKAMERIALEEVLKPLGFQEIIASHIVPFDVWLKTGHMEGMPGEFYYVNEPATRDVEQWERFVDLTKITKEIPAEELQKNLAIPRAGICYAQCPVIYWSLKGKTIAEKSLPVLLYDNTAISARYESGGRHGIERVDEFHRIEPVYIGTREQLLQLRDDLLDRYKHVFNDIFDLEWRMAWVTPWYMQQAGKISATSEQETGTIDFEAYMPYRGNRKDSEWLEFQNLSILGDKYVSAFNIKAQKSQLWSGCSGIGLQRWTVAFLAQKGLDPDKWPKPFRKYLPSLPEGIHFL